MFGNSSAKDEKKNRTESTSRSTPSSGSRGLNTITEGTRIEGDLVADSDIRIDGVIKGNLRCSAKVIIGVKGSFDGEISCVNAVLEGKFSGTLKVTDMLKLQETAKAKGEIKTNRLAMADGADFTGNIETGYKGDKNNNGGGNPLKQRKEGQGAKVNA